MQRRNLVVVGAATATAVIFLSIGATVYAQASAAAQGNSLKDRLGTVAVEAGFRSDTGSTTLSLYIGRIVNAAASLLGVIFVAQMVYAGWLWMTARDETDQLDKAKHIIRRSIVGLAIVLSAWAIAAFVIDRLNIATGII